MTVVQVSTELGPLSVRVTGGGGDRPDRPVVAWHSLFVDSTSWDRLLPALRHRPFYAIDAPSSGASAPLCRPVDIEACAEAAVDVVTALADRLAGPVHWLGNAWGGHVGMVLAATRPDLVRSLAAVSAPTFPVPSAQRTQIRALLPLYRVIGARGPVRSAILETILTDRSRNEDPDLVALIDECLARAGSRATVAAVRTAALNRTDLEWAARRISRPTLLVATEDRGEWTVEQARAAAALMPDARVASIVGARVIPALERPTELAAVLNRFWSEVESC